MIQLSRMSLKKNLTEEFKTHLSISILRKLKSRILALIDFSTALPIVIHRGQ
jgi:hypothetical protein